MLALESAKGYLRGELGHAVKLRHTPQLMFVEDRSTERAIEVNRVIAASLASTSERAEHDSE
jgi:ribosome-binding factor A